MAVQVKLTRGNTYLDLTAAPYAVGMDFTPPAVNPAYNISAGTSANRTGGGKLISDRYNNRTFEFSVRIMATSITGTHSAARAIASFLKAQSAEPLYLEYRENTDITVPLWGQLGAPLRYEIVTGDASSPDEKYTVTTGRGWFTTVTLEVKPLALGSRQKLANSTGSVFEDNYGMSDGTPRGLALFDNYTNLITNPVFGNSTYTSGWTTGSNLVVSKITDPRYCLPGITQSVRITSRGSTNNTFTQSITAANTNPHSLSAYIIMPDGGTPTTADVACYYNTDLTSTTEFINLGAGLWVMYAESITGIVAATATGVIVKNGRSINLLAVQFEETPFHSLLVYGDRLGCSWSGTAHASTSTGSNTFVTLARDENNMSLAEGAVSLVIQSGLDDAYVGIDQKHFSLSTSTYSAYGLQGWRDSSNLYLYLSDGTNTINTGAAVSSNTGNVKYITYTWGTGGLNIYVDGVLSATGATYTPATAANQTTLTIGLASSSEYLGFDVYGVELTAGQVSTLYAAQLATVTAGRRVSAIPYLWTKDGDGVIDNCDDSTRDNWAVIAGVCGSYDADFTHYFTSSTTTKTAYWLGGYAPRLHEFINPTTLWYMDQSGTVDANSSGGEYNTDATSPFDYGGTLDRKTAQNFNFFIRMAADGAGTITVTPYLSDSSGITAGDPKACTVSTTQTLYFIGTMSIDGERQYPNDLFRIFDRVSTVFHGEYSASLDARVDFCLVIPENLVKLDRAVITANSDYMTYNGQSAYLLSSTGALLYDVPVLGGHLRIEPDRMNVLWCVIADHGEAHVITDAITLTTYITPRYTLV